MYMQTLGALAGLAADRTFSHADLGALRSPSPVVHAGLALLLLLAATTLAVYKPAGRTRYGWHKQNEPRTASHPQTRV